SYGHAQPVRGSIYGYFHSYGLAVLICRTSIYRSTGRNDKLLEMHKRSLHLPWIYTTTFCPVTFLSAEKVTSSVSRQSGSVLL
ncbi:hypothetical protein COCHEDRAFT_1021538, partial [Bipolaris maydis C5]